MESDFYHEGSRGLQDSFDSRRLAGRLEAVTLHREFTDEDRAFIEEASFFLLATADAKGRPDCSFKGGAPGFVRVTGPDELTFPDYDGNGMFRNLGNIMVNPATGAGGARRSGEGRVHRCTASRACAGASDLSQLPALYPGCGWQFDLRTAPGRQASRAGLEGL